MTPLPTDRVTRRSFVAAAAASVATAVSPLSASSYARILGANDRLRLALIGAGGRGRYVMELLQGSDVEVVALCDVFASALEEARARVNGPAPRLLDDYRAVLDAPDVDANTNTRTSACPPSSRVDRTTSRC